MLPIKQEADAHIQAIKFFKQNSDISCISLADTWSELCTQINLYSHAKFVKALYCSHIVYNRGGQLVSIEGHNFYIVFRKPPLKFLRKNIILKHKNVILMFLCTEYIK